MNKVVLSAALGIVVGYTIRRCQEKKFFDKLFRNISVLNFRTKRKFIGTLDNIENEAEYISDHIKEEVINKDNRDNGVLNEISY